VKIDNSVKTVNSGAVSSSAAGGARPGNVPASPAGSGGGEQVDLSPLASQLQAIQSGMSDTPVVDTARVAEIKQAIANGQFRVNANAVADQLLQTARDLLRSRQG